MTAKPHMSFWKTAFIYGAPAGALVILMMIGGYTAFGMKSNAASQTVGFMLMFLFLSLIFFGMKRFRDQNQGGVIRFGKALGLGLAMSLFAGLVYVFIWEIYLAVTDSVFITEYIAHLIELEKAKGVSADALAEFTAKMDKMVENYASPFYRMPLTFTEIFPVGFIVSLVSALILHRPKFWARR